MEHLRLRYSQSPFIEQQVAFKIEMKVQISRFVFMYTLRLRLHPGPAVVYQIFIQPIEFFYTFISIVIRY